MADLIQHAISARRTGRLLRAFYDDDMYSESVGILAENTFAMEYMLESEAELGQKDIAEKVLEAYNDVFADIVNVLAYKGKRVVGEDELTDAAPRSAYKADGKYRELERDVIKHWMNNRIRLASIGLENQTETDADMPFRVMGYDAAEYNRQLKDGSYKERYPVVSLVLYFGQEHSWDGPLSIVDAMSEIPEELASYVSDYRINVFQIAYLEREVIDRFTSDFRIVADYFWQKRVKKDYVPDKTVIRHVQETLSMLSIFSGDRRFEDALNEEGPEGKESVNMCDVLDRIENRGIEKGKIEGKIEGINVGRAEAIRNLMDSLKFTAEQAMDALKIPVSEREKMMSML